ncbi:MAG: HAD family hydrolase [Phycisphaerae bacterium]|jgi:phosphoglycolate phosphatase
MSGGEIAQKLGVIFDLDGTLADTLDDIVDAINAVFSQIGRPPVSPEMVRPHIGIGLLNLVRQTAGIDDTDQILALVDQYRPVYTERMLNKTRLYEGIDEVLDTLTELGIPMCVLSNKPHEYTEPMCEALLSRWPFVRICGCADTDTRKPNPANALELAKAMQREPSNVYLIGDSPVDVETAHNAGMVSVAVTWGYGDRAAFETTEPRYMVDHPADFSRAILASLRASP